MVCIRGLKQFKNKPNEQETKGQCIDVWMFDLKIQELARLEGIQEAIERMRNAIAQPDPSDPFNDNKATPKPDPAIMKLINMIEKEMANREAIVQYEVKKMLSNNTGDNKFHGIEMIGDLETDNIKAKDSNGTTLYDHNDVKCAKTVAGGSFQLKTGTSVSEFSIDGTLAGNSDTAIPTEKAVKTYVDTEISSVSTPLSAAIDQNTSDISTNTNNNHRPKRQNKDRIK